MRSLFVAISLFAAALPGVAHAWWEQAWSYRKQVTVDTTPAGVNLVGEIGRMPVLVRLHSGNFTFSDVQENGSDIRFVASDDKTPLTYHIENFDALLGVATVWVDVPVVAGGAQQKIWLYYGNKSAPAAVDTPGTYDADTVAVYHFDDAANAPLTDKTAYKNNAQNAPAAVADASVIGKGGQFNGAPVTVAPSDSLNAASGAPLTISLWVKEAAPSANAALISRGPLVIGLEGGTPYATVGGVRLAAGAPATPGQFTHIALVADGRQLSLFVNGKQAGTAPGLVPALNQPLLIGGAPGAPFTGVIDEIEISKVARNTAFIQAISANQGSESKLLAFGEDEEQGEGGGVLGFIISKTPFADWVIIGLCMLLLALAVWAMVLKGQYIGKAASANKLFLKRYRAMTGHLNSIEKDPEVKQGELKRLRHSPLFRLFETGIEELDIRRETLGDRPLSGENVEAIRAAIDATQVEENQKLDNLMVLLTIAIAGGPFIGLLGTVIGVMKTFGGVALAGDVNINAIAPGIAAALLATVAGLAAAIPALFGYNYLNSRITALSDQMRIFVDRLITRLAEQQAEHHAPPAQRLAAE